MADKKISELDAITGSNTAATDVFVVVDTSTGQTKKITREELNNAIEQDVLSSIDIDTINGDFTVNGNINLGDDDKAIFGAGSDLQIFHQSSNGNSIIKEQGGGILSLQSNGSEISFYDTANLANMARFITGGGVQLYHNGSSKFSTSAGGVNVTGALTVSGDLTVNGTTTTINSTTLTIDDKNIVLASGAADAAAANGAGITIDGANATITYNSTSGKFQFSNGIKVSDNVHIVLGEAGDLKLYHTGSDSVIQDAGQGDLYVKASNNLWFQGNTSNDIMARFQDNGAVTLYYDNSAKLATTSTGIDVTGTVTADNIDLSATGALESVGTIFIDIDKDNTSTTAALKITADGQAKNVAWFYENGDFWLYEDTGTNAKIKWNSTQEDLIFSNNVQMKFLKADGTDDNTRLYRAGGDALRFDYDGNVFITRALDNDNWEFRDSSDDTQLVFRPSDSRLGIGVATNPLYNMHIKGSGSAFRLGLESDGLITGQAFITDNSGSPVYASISSGLGNLTFAADTGNSYASSYMDFQIDGSEKARLTSDGHLGIGVSNNIIGDITLPNDGIISFHDASGISRNSLQFLSGELRHGGAGGGLTSQTFYTNGQQRVRIDSAGLVGIGTSSPAAKIDSQEAYDTVSNILTNGTYAAKFGGNTAVGAAGRAQGIMISGRSGNTRGAAIIAENQGSGNGHDLLFATSANASVPAERLRITDAGLVGINTNPNYQLEVKRSSSGAVAQFLAEDGTNNPRLVIGGDSSGSYINHSWSTGAPAIRFLTASTERMRLSGVNLMVGGTVHNPAASNTAGAISLRGDVGRIEASYDGGAALELNRKTNDGAIINLRKDGTTVGSIGVNNANNTFIGSTTTAHTGLEFGNDILPRKGSNTADNQTNLGSSSIRFKDLRLGGVAYLSDGTSSGTQTVVGGNYYIANSGSYPIVFQTGGTERARLDTSANLLVGTTSDNVANQTGTTQGVRIAGGSIKNIQVASTGTTAYFNRLTTDGNIAEFRKNGTTVGSIGSAIGNAYFAGSSTGITFGSANVYPTNASGTKSSGTLTLGSASNRFDDLYLGGTANAVTINTDGPTGTGNGIVMAASGWPYKGRIGMNGTSGGKQYWTANYNLNTSSVDSASYYSTYIENSAQDGIIAFGTSSAVNTAPSERARIDSSGRLGLGETSLTYDLQSKQGSSASNKKYFKFDQTSSYGGGIESQSYFGSLFIGRVGTTGIGVDAFAVYPADATVVSQGYISDNSLDLGKSTSRWADGYFGGKVEASNVNPDIITVGVGKFTGDGTSSNASGISYSRTATGSYTISFSTARPDADYIVTAQVVEPSSSLDAVIIHVIDGTQATTGFDVKIHEGDNGTAPGTLFDRDFYIVVHDIV